MLRSEINLKDTWDLSLIFKDVNEFEKACSEVEKEVEELKKYEDSIITSSDNLYNAIKDFYEVGDRVERVYTYAHLKLSEDTSNNESQRLMGKVQNLYTKFSENTVFYDIKILSLSEELFEKFLFENDKLKEYEINLRNIYKYKNHTLSDNEEKLLAAFQKERMIASDVYETFTDSDLRFGTIIDEDGNEVRLTDTNYSIYIKAENRSVRKSAFDTLYKTYKQYQNTFAGLYAGQIEVEKVCSKVKKYKSSLEASLFADDVTPEIYDNIINSVSNKLNVLFKYYKMRKKVLGLDEMHVYDIYAPLIPNIEKKYTYEEAVSEVLEATKVLGDEYVNILKEGYEKRWVDVYANEGKRGGAFSGGCSTTEPYILLNFQGTEYDVSTLAHESGHSMHSYYTRKNNPIQYADYKIFVAEVPSTVNELLLAYYRLENTDNKLEKLSILNSLLELYKATIYRQIMFAEFEKITHELSEKGEILTAELVNKTYYDIVKKYFGDEVILDENISYEWMRVPHFYYNFYVYKYAVGLTGASQIVKNIRNNVPGALENYFEFLKIGNKLNPIESLKVAGVDFTSTDVFDSAVEIFDELIDDFEKLYDEVYNS